VLTAAAHHEAGNILQEHQGYLLLVAVLYEPCCFISSVAKSESAIPPFSNLITLPQFLLAGTFFPIDNFPKWLQPLCRLLPLSYLNDALRKIAFEGYNIWDVRVDILILLIWGVVIYALASRIFKWE
jgi:ABC-2 type transport system permease protein